MKQLQSDRRRERRKAAKRRVSVTCRKGLDGLGADLCIRLVDVSDEGAKIQIKEWINQNSDVEVTFDVDSLNKPLVVTGQVAWCQPVENGFTIGVKFHDRIDYVDLGHLV
jgi:hypothetical protein